MDATKNTFTLNPACENFVPGVSTLEFSSVGPNGCFAAGCLLLSLFYMGILVFCIATALFLNHWLELFRTQGVETSGQVIDCQIVTYKDDTFSQLTYTYNWNNTSFQGRNDVYSPHPDCVLYLNQTVAVRLIAPNPDISRLIMTETEFSKNEGPILAVLVGLLTLCMVPISLFHLIPFLSYRRAKRIYPRLINEGYVLIGEIVEIRGYVPAKSTDFIVRVNYQFQSPSGEILKGRRKHHRQDLKDQPLPSIGTPVQILYADDRAYVML